MFGSGPSIPSLVGRGISMNRLPLAIWAMVLGAFAMGADEFIVAGVVREIAQGLNVSCSAVGALESVYALGVAVGAPVLTAIGTRFGRRSMLLTTGVFLVGNIVSLSDPTTRPSWRAGSSPPPPTAPF